MEVEARFDKLLELFEIYLKTTLKFDTYERIVLCATTDKKFSKHIIYRFYNESIELVFKNNVDMMWNLILLFENDVKNFSNLRVEDCINKEFIKQISPKSCEKLMVKN